MSFVSWSFILQKAAIRKKVFCGWTVDEHEQKVQVGCGVEENISRTIILSHQLELLIHGMMDGPL